jgi:hypothetical protein
VFIFAKPYELHAPLLHTHTLNSRTDTFTCIGRRDRYAMLSKMPPICRISRTFAIASIPNLKRITFSCHFEGFAAYLILFLSGYILGQPPISFMSSLESVSLKRICRQPRWSIPNVICLVFLYLIPRCPNFRLFEFDNTVIGHLGHAMEILSRFEIIHHSPCRLFTPGTTRHVCFKWKTCELSGYHEPMFDTAHWLVDHVRLLEVFPEIHAGAIEYTFGPNTADDSWMLLFRQYDHLSSANQAGRALFASTMDRDFHIKPLPRSVWPHVLARTNRKENWEAQTLSINGETIPSEKAVANSKANAIYYMLRNGLKPMGLA